jgi:hypothetical protein
LFVTLIAPSIARAADDTPASTGSETEAAPPPENPTPELKPPTPPPVAPAAAPVAAKKMHVGAKLGLNWAWLAGDDVNSSATSATTGFMGGGFLVYRMNKVLSLQPELLFQQKGTDSTTGGNIEVDYISLPILARITLPINEAGSLRPYIVGGPEVGLNVIAKVSGGGATMDIKSMTALLEVGVDLGAGVEYTTEKQQILTFELRYGFGLTTLDKGSTGAKTNDIENQVITFDVGWGF